MSRLTGPGDRAREGLPAAARLATDAAGFSVGLALATVAAVRRGKALHPDGVVHRARLVVPGATTAPRGARLFTEAGDHEAIVRFSRSLGLPRSVPDLLGLSIRVPDAYGPGAHQDILLVTSADQPVLHHIFLPAIDVQQRPYSSALPFRALDELFLIGAVPDPDSPRPEGGDELDRLARAAATGRLRFGLGVAPINGRFRNVADLQIGERLPREFDALRFDPWNSGGGLAPVGFLNRLRDYAYPLSQTAWRFSRGAALDQDRADRRVAELSREG